jgi:tRNA threonylcarbamoyladenosine biosynthesis protein TsaB
VVDARHANVYAALVAADGRPLLPAGYHPVAVAATAAAEHAAAVVGPGAEAVLAAWPAGTAAPAEVDRRGFADIADVARLGAARGPDVAPCRPLYLKEADAKPQSRPPLGGTRGR